MSPDAHHVRGVILAIVAALEGCGAWFLAHIQLINGVMQFCLFTISFITCVVGLRKVLRKSA